jgi:hypothetical protein
VSAGGLEGVAPNSSFGNAANRALAMAFISALVDEKDNPLFEEYT